MTCAAQSFAGRPRARLVAQSTPNRRCTIGSSLLRWSATLACVTPLASCLLLSALLFAIGLAGALIRRNAIIVVAGIELMLNAANLNFIAFWRYGPNPTVLTGVIFAIFSIGVAAAEAAVGLALIISIYQHYRTINLDQIHSMKG